MWVATCPMVECEKSLYVICSAHEVGPTNHISNCYFCMSPVDKCLTKNTILYSCDERSV